MITYTPITQQFERSQTSSLSYAAFIVPSAHSTSTTILGAISVDDVIEISLRKPTSSIGSKKRKVDGKEVKINSRVGKMQD